MARTSGYKRRKYDDIRPMRPQESQKTPMLNIHKTMAFKFDLKEIMTHYQVSEPVAASVLATVIAKGSRVSIEAAKAFVREQGKLGAFPNEATEEICDLLDRWSRYR